jgi:hypothetical protein
MSSNPGPLTQKERVRIYEEIQKEITPSEQGSKKKYKKPGEGALKIKGGKRISIPKNPDPFFDLVAISLEKTDETNNRKRTEIPIIDCPQISVEFVREKFAKFLPEVSTLVEKPKMKPTKGTLTKDAEKALMKSYTEGFEVEASFGTYTSELNFKPGVSRNAFAAVFKMLDHKKNFPKTTEETSEVEIDSNNVRKISSGKRVFFEKKDRIETYDSKYPFRISTSKETLLEGNLEPSVFEPVIRRERHRISYEKFPLRVDLTEVVEETLALEAQEPRFEEGTFLERIEGIGPLKYYREGRKPRQEKRGKFVKRLEIEVELISRKDKSSKNIKYSDFDDLIFDILFVIQNVDSYDKLITNEEYLKVCSQHNNLLKAYATQGLVQNYWSKPTNLQIEDLVSTEYGVTPKLDGTREILIFTDTGIYTNSRPDLRKIGDPAATLVGSIIDCEYFEKDDGKKYYFIFDVLVITSKDVRNQKLRDRLAARGNFDGVQLWNQVIINASKPYFFEEDVFLSAYNATLFAKKAKNDLDFDFDGLIYQPTGSYTDLRVRKWKPANLLTIDFELTPSKNENSYNYFVYDQKSRKKVHFDVYYQKKVREQIYYKNGPKTSFIAECYFDSENHQFAVMRLRSDRTNPNEKSVAYSIWKDIMRPIDLKTIIGADLKIMSRLHNRTKEYMLRHFRDSESIIDIGSGQGGDLDKWENQRIKTVYAVEPDPQKIKVFNQRLQKKRFSVDVKIFNKGAEETQEILEFTKGPVSGISAFFSLTFFGGDKAMLQDLVNTISAELGINSKFIGIVLDGDSLHSLLDQYGGKIQIYADSNKPKNEDNLVFSIEETGETSIITPEFTSRKVIVKIPGSFLEKGIEEWTFPFGFFRKILKAEGINLGSSGFLSPINIEETGWLKYELKLKITGNRSGKVAITIPKGYYTPETLMMKISEELRRVTKTPTVWKIDKQYRTYKFVIPEGKYFNTSFTINSKDGWDALGFISDKEESSEFIAEVPQKLFKEPEEQKIMNSLIDSSYNKLPLDSQIYSGLQRYFVFSRKYVKKPQLKIDPPTNRPSRFSRKILGVNFEEYNLNLLPMLQDQSALFGCFLALSNPDFLDPKTSEIESLKSEITEIPSGKKSDKNRTNALRKLELAINRERANIIRNFRKKILPTWVEENPRKIPKSLEKKYGAKVPSKSSYSRESLQQSTIAKLKSILNDLGLDDTGKKEELIKRILSENSVINWSLLITRLQNMTYEFPEQDILEILGAYSNSIILLVLPNKGGVKKFNNKKSQVYMIYKHFTSHGAAGQGDFSYYPVVSMEAAEVSITKFKAEGQILELLKKI